MPLNEEGAALDWAKHEDEIRTLLSTKTLPQVTQHMREKYNFDASDAQYKHRFSGCKNLTTEEWMYVDNQIERRAELGKQTIVCFNGRELLPDRVSLACSRARKKGSENRVGKPRQKQHNQPRRISLRTPSPATVGGNPSPAAAVNNQGLQGVNSMQRGHNDGLRTLTQHPSPTIPSAPVPGQASDSPRAWTEWDGVPTLPATFEPMFDFVGTTSVAPTFTFDDLDVMVDIESALEAGIGVFTTWSPQPHNSPQPETTMSGSNSRAAGHWRPSSSSILSPANECVSPMNFNLIGTNYGRNLQQGDQLPFFRVLFEIEHPRHSLPRHPPLCEPLPSATDASSGLLIVVQRSLSAASASKTDVDSIASVAKVSSHLQQTIPERGEGDLSRTLERILDPSSPPSATLLSLFALAAFFASNNNLGDGQTDAFLNWVIKQGYEAFLIWFMKIQTPTIHAFAKVVLESSIRIKNVQVLETLIASGVKLDNKLYEIASIGDVTLNLTRDILLRVDPARLATTPMGADLFHKFVSDRQYDLAQFLLGVGVSADARRTRSAVTLEPAHHYYRTALYLAVTRHDIAAIKFLFEAGASVNSDHQGHHIAPKSRHTALGYAVFYELTDIVILLLEYKADVFATIEGMPVLEWAAMYRRGMFELLQKRVERGERGVLLGDVLDAARRGCHALAAYISTQPEGVTPQQLEEALEQSIKSDRFMPAATLLQHGVNPNGPTLQTRPLELALCYVDFFESLHMVELLLQHQARVDPELLGKLAKIGDQRLLKMVLGRDIDVGQREKALVVACSESDDGKRDSGNIPLLATLIDSKLDINTPGLLRSPLQAAAENEDEITVLFLISRGANVNAPPHPREGRTALQAALETCTSCRVANLLLYHGADTSAPPAAFDGLTALEAFCHNSAAANGPEFCDILVGAGATVNRPGGESSSVLHGVIKRGWHDVLSRFLKPPHSAIIDHMWCDKSSGAGVDCRDQWRRYTPTQLAASLGDLEAVKLLLDHGADVNEAPADECGRTAMQAASLLAPGPKKTALIQLLLDRGADIHTNAAIQSGITSLQGAAIAGDLILAQRLIHLGADANAWPSFSNGRTAVEAAAEHGRLDMVQLLLNAGAKGDVMRGTGFEEAIKLAEKNGHFAVASLFK
ncbi:ankyrin repeat-containing domain protein [Chaetomium tenue]|uniref:Ankyrin repeat-containing domain protein n=1 Tax=Chaetomium tenue TaxID=1854479 RepID=A0ACB7NXM3_9PEZI|nr:ankyrin repeat-containing domain protein [Chaetomium globosum]